MMIPPREFMSYYIDSDYSELIKVRDGLIRSIRNFEKNEKKGDRSGEEWKCYPKPDLRYQFHLEYLAQISILMCAKYRKEYVWDDKTLAMSDKSSNNKSESNSDLIWKLSLEDIIDANGIDNMIYESMTYLDLITLPEEIKQKIINGKMSIKHAMKKYLKRNEPLD